MCGRYAFFTAEENNEIRNIANIIESKYGKGHMPNGEIFPTAVVPVLIGDKSNKDTDAELIKWGFDNFMAKNPIINARAETVSEKRMFAKSFKNRRCIIPSTGFYEWSKEEKDSKIIKQKYIFNLPHEPMVYLAGIYNELDDKRKFVILTTEANESMRAVHDRMPVIIIKEQMQAWLYDEQYSLHLIKEEPPILIKKAV